MFTMNWHHIDRLTQLKHLPIFFNKKKHDIMSQNLKKITTSIKNKQSDKQTLSERVIGACWILHVLSSHKMCLQLFITLNFTLRVSNWSNSQENQNIPSQSRIGSKPLSSLCSNRIPHPLLIKSQRDSVSRKPTKCVVFENPMKKGQHNVSRLFHFVFI